MEKIKKWARLLIINAVIMAFILLTIELAVRITFPEITTLGISKDLFQKNRYGVTYGLTPNVVENVYGINITTNKEGFRIDTTLTKFNNNSTLPKILIVGDSIGFGNGVEDEFILSSILQRKTNMYKIINTSAIGYNIEDYYNLLEALTDKGYDFDGAIICLCLNDIDYDSQCDISKSINTKNKKYFNNLFRNAYVRAIKKVSISIGFNAILPEYSRAYLLMRNFLVDSGKGYFLADLGLYKRTNAAEYMTKKLQEINQLLKENGKWAVFFLCPYEYQLRQESTRLDVLRPQRMFTKIAQEEGIELVDLYPVFNNKIKADKLDTKSLYLFGDPMHFSEIGHQIIYKVVWEKIAGRIE